MIDALIVDDESLARKGMRTLFPWDQHGFRIVGEAPVATRPWPYQGESGTFGHYRHYNAQNVGS